MRAKHLALVVVAGVLLARHAFGQVPSIPAKGETVVTNVSLTELDALDEAVRSGNFKTAATAARSILAAAKDRAVSKDAFDCDKNVLALVWASEESAGKFVLRRFHLPQPEDGPNRLDIPGVGTASSGTGFYELLLTGDSAASLSSVYSSVRQEDELLAQIPDFVAGIASPLFTFAADLAGRFPEGGGRGGRTASTSGEKPTVRVTSSRVLLPYERATIQVAATLSAAMPVARFEEQANKVAVSLKLNDVPRSRAARKYADDVVKPLVEVAKCDACTKAYAESAGCSLEFDRALTALYESATLGKSMPDDDRRAIEAVDAAFRRFVAGLQPLRVEGRASFRNRPLTRYTLGLGAAVIFGDRSHKTRAAVSGGNVVADPPSRQMTMALVNISFRRYDADAYRISGWERVRGFAGAILTPDFGASGGLSVLVVRGFAVNVGAGVLLTRAVEDTTVLGQPAATDPFSLGRIGVVFAGASYNFK